MGRDRNTRIRTAHWWPKILLLIFAAAVASPSFAQTVKLESELAPEVTASPTFGRLNAGVTLPLQLWFKHHNQAELNALIAAQQDPSSSQYRKWLAPDEFVRRFGASAAETDSVSKWLSAKGFQMTGGSARDGYLTFNGDVATIESAFNTRMMAYAADGSKFANLTAPEIPAPFAGTISGIRGLNNLEQAVPLHRQIEPSAGETWTNQSLAFGPPRAPEQIAYCPAAEPPATPEYHNPIWGTRFAPADIYTFYDETPLLPGTNGGGTGNDCIAIYDGSDTFTDIVNAFDTTFGLSPVNLSRVNVDGSAFGQYNGDETETLLDIEWAHAIAPGAPISLYLSADIPTAVERVLSDDACGAINISYGYCGGVAPSFFTGTLDPIFQQAAAQGISVFVSAGDQGAAGLNNRCSAASSRNVSEMSADPNVVSVGGTSFFPVFDGSGNDVGLVAESVWNDSDLLGGAGGGGVSGVFFKPAFQAVAGGPSGPMRAVPDVAMIASPERPGVFFFDDGKCIRGSSCGTDAPTLNVVGG